MKTHRTPTVAHETGGVPLHDRLSTAATARARDGVVSSLSVFSSSPRVVAQARRMKAVVNGARTLAQRRQFERVFPAATFRSADHLGTNEGEDGPALQAKKGGDASSSGSGSGGLPTNLKAGIEALSGVSMDSVRVHRNSTKPAALGALAYAQGTDIHLARGQEHHLPHEAWHVVQQAQGRVKATRQLMRGVPLNEDPALEREADLMGDKATRHTPS